MLPEVAPIVTVPPLSVVARPPDVIVAIFVFDELHVTDPVRFTEVPSVNLPVAVYCTFVPTFTFWFAGVTVTDTNAAGPTVKVVRPVTPAVLAVTWDVPCATPLARPPAVMVATVVVAETQVAEVVRSWVDPSE